MKEKFVHVGRVCLINFGHDINKLCTIVDIVGASRVLVDGPASVTGVSRHVISLKRVSLTKLAVKIPRGARQATLLKAVKEADLLAKWEKTSWARKLRQRAVRQSMTDFDRFKVMAARIKVHGAVRRELAHAVAVQRKQAATAAATKKKKDDKKKPAAKKPAEKKPAEKKPAAEKSKAKK